MRIQQTQLQQIKLALHAGQLVFLIIGGILALVVLTKDGQTGGSVSFYFALCFLTLPCLAYQILVPMWSRAWRFANVYAYAALDAFFTILWLAAFASVSVWQSSGGSCNSKFKYGSSSKCSTAQASVGFGVLVFLLFGATTAISVMGLLKYRKTGILPYSTSERHGEAVVVKKDEDPWSTNTDELEQQTHPNRDSDDEAELRRAYGQPLPEEDNLLHRPSRDDPFHDAQETHSMIDTQTEGGAHPGRPMSFTSDMSITTTLPAYQEQAPQGVPGVNIISPSGYVAPSALSPSDYAQTPGGRINFPSGNYGADFR